MANFRRYCRNAVWYIEEGSAPWIGRHTRPSEMIWSRYIEVEKWWDILSPLSLINPSAGQKLKWAFSRMASRQQASSFGTRYNVMD